MHMCVQSLHAYVDHAVVELIANATSVGSGGNPGAIAAEGGIDALDKSSSPGSAGGRWGGGYAS